jgi:spermidine/putrescine transport system permease protein
MQLRAWCMPMLVSCVYLFLYIPIIVLIIFSFNGGAYSIDWTGFSTRWYSALFHSSEAAIALINSVIVAFFSVILSVTLGSSYVFYASFSGLRFFSLFFYLSLAIPEIVVAAGLLSMFVVCGVPFGLITLITAHTILGLGYVIPIVGARLQELDTRLVEASYDLGATKSQTFWYIVLPFLAPSILAASLLVFIISLDDFILSFFCAGPSTQTLPVYLFSLIRAGASPMVNVISTLMLIVSACIIALFSWVEFGRERQ